MNLKKHSNAKIISFIALAIAVLSILVAIETGTSGGEVRHTEIRSADVKTIGTENDQEKD